MEDFYIARGSFTWAHYGYEWTFETKGSEQGLVNRCSEMNTAKPCEHLATGLYYGKAGSRLRGKGGIGEWEYAWQII